MMDINKQKTNCQLWQDIFKVKATMSATKVDFISFVICVVVPMEKLNMENIWQNITLRTQSTIPMRVLSVERDLFLLEDLATTWKLTQRDRPATYATLPFDIHLIWKGIS